MVLTWYSFRYSIESIQQRIDKLESGNIQDNMRHPAWNILE